MTSARRQILRQPIQHSTRPNQPISRTGQEVGIPGHIHEASCMHVHALKLPLEAPAQVPFRFTLPAWLLSSLVILAASSGHSQSRSALHQMQQLTKLPKRPPHPCNPGQHTQLERQSASRTQQPVALRTSKRALLQDNILRLGRCAEHNGSAGPSLAACAQHRHLLAFVITYIAAQARDLYK